LGVITGSLILALLPASAWAQGNISGTVTDAGTAALLNSINVNIFSSTGNFVSGTSTNASGVYTVNGLAAGSYFAVAGSSTYQPKAYNNIPCLGCNITTTTPIAVSNGVTTTSIDFALLPGGSITGTVTDAGTAAPLANVTVQIFTSAGNFANSTSTNASGVYSTVGLPAGNYFARTFTTSNGLNYQDKAYNNIACLGCNITTATPIAVTVPATTSGINFALLPGGNITGTATDAGTAALLASVNVSIYTSTGAFVLGTFTNASGVYKTGGLPAGNYFARTFASSIDYQDKAYNNIPCPSCNITTATPIAVTVGATTSSINFALSPGGVITGTVTDAGTAALLAGVSVNIYTSTGAFVLGTSSNGSGVYRTGALPAGNYFARTFASSVDYQDKAYNNIPCLGCNITSATPIAVTVGATTPGIDFALLPGGGITGTVTDAGTAAPLAGMNVQIFTSTGAFANSTSTNASGVYTMGGLPAGSYFARTFAAQNALNYQDQAYNNIACVSCNITTATPIAVTVGANTSGINFALLPGGSITGTVTDAGTAAPLNGVSVQVFTSTGAFVVGTNTNASGVYRTGGLPAGSYFARTFASAALNYQDKAYNNIPCLSCSITTATPIAVTVGATTSGINFALLPGGGITGTVTDAGTAAPLAGVTVDIYTSTGSFAKGTSTNASGVYSVGGLPAGNYFARTFSALNYADKAYNNIPCLGCNITTATPIAVTVGATTASINFALSPGGSITGTVTDAGTAALLAGVTVEIATSTGSFVVGTSTNASGVYTIGGLPAGSYFARTFVSTALNYLDVAYNNIPCALSSCTITAATPIAVTAGATTSSINFALPPGGSISGTVTDAGTAALLANVTVQVATSTGTFVKATVTNASGVYTVGGLPSGSYFARTAASAVNYQDKAYNNLPCLGCNITTATPIAVTVGATTSGINFALLPGGSITGTVTDAGTAAPLANVTVEIASSAGAFVVGAATNASGVYTVGGLPAGSYFARTFVSTAQNYLDEAYNNIPCALGACVITTATPIAVSVGATTSGINFALQPGGTITGTVTDAGTAAPLSNVTVQVYTSTGVFAKGISTDGSGVYTLRGLPAGSYFARTFASSVNYLDKAYNNVPCALSSCNITTTTPIAVSVGATTSAIDFALSPGGRITGTVTDAGTAAPLANVTVEIATSTGTFVAGTSTNASGVYTVGGLPTGSYFARTFVSSAINYVDQAYNNIPCVGCTITTATPIAVTVGGTTSGINFALSAGGSITGTVTDADTGAALTGATVFAFTSAGVNVKSVASIGGAYTLAGLAAGTYFVASTDGGAYVPQLFNGINCPHGDCQVTTGTPIAVTVGATHSGINLALRPTPDDVVVNFGPPYGLWLLTAGSTWQPLHPLSPVSMVTGDLDGNGQDDLVVNFGPGIGIWAWMNHSTWTFIHPFSPSQMVTGDLDGNGHDDLVVVFPGYGIWTWSDGNWTHLHPLDATHLAVGRLDGVAGADLVVDFPGYGLWEYANNTTWTPLHPLDVTTLVIADLDGNGRDDIVVDFPGYGIWVLYDNGTWGHLHSLSPTHIAAGHIDNNGAADLVIDFGSTYGLWTFRNNTTWLPLHPLTSQNLLLLDRDHNAKDEILVNFGPPYGLWQYANDSVWSPLHSLSPRDLAAGHFR
jgi:hypothetical protein